MKPKFKEIDLTDHNNKKETDGWQRSTMPYVMVFLHCPKGSFVIRGYAHTVDKYIKRHFPINVQKKHYFGPKRRETQNRWYFDGLRELPGGCFIASPQEEGFDAAYSGNKYRFYGWEQGERVEFLRLRRIPNKWIPEYDEIVRRCSKGKKR